MTDLEGRLRDMFAARCGGVPDLIARAPGRVNLIGEHTDYNDGFVLPMAISGQTMVAARARTDPVIRIIATDLDGAECQFAFDAPIAPDPLNPWSNYVRGVADSLLLDGVPVTGADLVIGGTVPQGAGLSSSASLEMASGLALAALAGQAGYDRTRLALAGQRAEREFAGCNCGIMDQLVSARAEAGHAMLLDCRTLTTSSISMPADVAVMIVHSGIERGLVDGEYNQRRMQCETAARHYGVAALRDLDLETLESGSAGLDPLAVARARHVVSENTRTLAAAEALERADLAALGQLMAESHESMRADFAITTRAIDALAQLLRAAIGENGGARMTGGGFGGAVVAVMPQSAVDMVRDKVAADYRTPAGKQPLIMVEAPQDGASLLIN